MLAQLLPANTFALMLVFSRVGSALMLLPGFGDLYVPPRYRLLLAMALSLIVASVLGSRIPALPASPATLAALVGGEIVIGLFLGSIARIVMSALETGGMIISLQLGLSAAQVFNPAEAQQSAVTSTFLTVLGSLIVLLTDTHHLLLRGIVGSYDLFPPGAFPPIGDLSNTVARIAALSFKIAAELSAPFIIVGMMFFVALGLLSRLMPQFQIFFVAMPLQVAGGLLVFAFTLLAVLHWYIDTFVQALGTVFVL